nr:MAG TPA: hypothetical protein [Caudoviricetes sp.]
MVVADLTEYANPSPFFLINTTTQKLIRIWQ